MEKKLTPTEKLYVVRGAKKMYLAGKGSSFLCPLIRDCVNRGRDIDELGEELKRVLGLPENKIRNIHNGILLRRATESRDAFFERMGLDKDRILIGVVAVLEERKGHIHLFYGHHHGRFRQ